MRVACILASRSMAVIDGGTNRSLRMIEVDDSGTERLIALRSSAAVNGFFRRAFETGLTVACCAM